MSFSAAFEMSDCSLWYFLYWFRFFVMLSFPAFYTSSLSTLFQPLASSSSSQETIRLSYLSSSLATTLDTWHCYLYQAWFWTHFICPHNNCSRSIISVVWQWEHAIKLLAIVICSILFNVFLFIIFSIKSIFYLK